MKKIIKVFFFFVNYLQLCHISLENKYLLIKSYYFFLSFSFAFKTNELEVFEAGELEIKLEN